MNYILRDIKNTSVFKEVIKKDNYPVEISGLVFVAKNALIANLNNEKKKPVMVVTYNEIQAQNMIKNLSYFIDDVRRVLNIFIVLSLFSYICSFKL